MNEYQYYYLKVITKSFSVDLKPDDSYNLMRIARDNEEITVKRINCTEQEYTDLFYFK